MRLFVLSLFALLSSATAGAATLSDLPAGTYALDKTHASITWKVDHLGLSKYTARFTEFDATVNLNPADPAQSTLEVTINPASVRTDYPNAAQKDFDNKLAKGEDWFNAGTHPQISFKATAIEITADNTGTLTGDLTLLGETQPLTLDVAFNGAMLEHPFANKPAMGFSATGTVKRSLWGFDTYIPNIGDEVEVLIEVEFIKAD